MAGTELRLAGIVDESVVDGLGIRMVVFAQGCPHNCKGCHNPDSHDFKQGKIFDIEFIQKLYLRNPLLDGVTLSGGEPFCQGDALSQLAAWVKSRGGDVWCYSGYTFEELLRLCETDTAVKNLFNQVDVLVDGRYDENLRDLMLKFRGSSNQRILDMKKSRDSKTPIPLNLEY